MPQQNTALTHPSDPLLSSNKTGKLRKSVRTLLFGTCVVGAVLAWVIDYRLTRAELRNSEENWEMVQKDMRERGLTAEEYRRIKGKITAEVPRGMSVPTHRRNPSKAEMDLPMETVRRERQWSEEARRKNLERDAELEKRQKAEMAEYEASPEYERKVVRAHELEEARLALQRSERQSSETKEEMAEEVERTARRKAIDTGVKDPLGRYYPSIPAGEFQMGSSKEPDSPVRTVLLETFVIGQSEITYGEWTSTLKWATAHGYDIQSGGEGKDLSHPVTNVSWFEAVAWSNAKSEREGLTPCYYLTEKAMKGAVYRVPAASSEAPTVHWHADGYRLPTEAEWEKAARGGHVDRFYPNGNTLTKADANFSNEGGGTTPVMSYKPNSYALFDMAGNVWEWCWNIHEMERGFNEQTARGIRGGGWELNAEGCRVSFIAAAFAETKSNDRGFRLVRRPRETAVRGAETAATTFKDPAKNFGSVSGPVYLATPAAGTPQKQDSLALIPAGPFQMGNEPAPDAPEHTVEVGAFYIGKTEVTKGGWDAVQKWAAKHGYTFVSSGLGLDVDLPVNSVSWCDVLKWCNARSAMEGVTPCYHTSAAKIPASVYRRGQMNLTAEMVNWQAKGYRLPAEAEWEKAARGGWTASSTRLGMR